jgi:hypothetical protein
LPYFFSASVKKVREEIILVFLFVIATKKPVRRGGKEKSLALGKITYPYSV